MTAGERPLRSKFTPNAEPSGRAVTGKAGTGRRRVLPVQGRSAAHRGLTADLGDPEWRSPCEGAKKNAPALKGPVKANSAGHAKSKALLNVTAIFSGDRE